MIYYPEPDSQIRDNVKVALDLSNYATTKVLDQDIGDDLVVKKNLLLLNLNLTN